MTCIVFRIMTHDIFGLAADFAILSLFLRTIRLFCKWSSFWSDLELRPVCYVTFVEIRNPPSYCFSIHLSVKACGQQQLTTLISLVSQHTTYTIMEEACTSAVVNVNMLVVGKLYLVVLNLPQTRPGQRSVHVCRYKLGPVKVEEFMLTSCNS